MTKKLYYENVNQRTFQANVIRRTEEYVVLDQTAFYPEGGGQPGDTGTINDVAVLDTQEIDDEIRHYTKTSIKNDQVKAEINFNRRFDHMQQHSGQHILSAAFVRLYNIDTVSFHLGEGTVTIDLDTSSVTDEQLRTAEREANRIVADNRKIETIWVEKEQLHLYPMRRVPKVDKNIRLVNILEYDYNGCGGTHPEHTSQVGIIKLLSTERVRKRVRLHFICGLRAIDVWNEQEQVAAREEKQLRAQVKEQAERMESLQQERLVCEAQELLRDNINIINVYENRSVKEIQALARTITATNTEAAVQLFVKNGDQLQCVFAKGENAEGNMNDQLQKILPLIDGKGGGSKQFAQGGGTFDESALAQIMADEL